MTQLDRIRVARGGKRPETPEEWAQYERDKDARLAKNVDSAREILSRNGVAYYDHGRVNKFIHFVIRNADEELWYYPETGLWFNINQLQPEQHFGCRNLVRHILGEVS